MASGKPVKAAKRDAKRAARAKQGKPATSTAPLNDREEARTRQREAPAKTEKPAARRHQMAASGPGPITAEDPFTHRVRRGTLQNGPLARREACDIVNPPKK